MTENLPIQNPLAQVPPAKTSGRAGKPCLITCLILLGIALVLAVLAWFVFRPIFFKWFCKKGSEEQGIIKMDENSYYHACLKKYHIEK